MSEKKYDTTITDMPSPPRSQPTSARASSTSECDMPARSIRLPANTKDGMASSTQLCDAAIMLEPSCCIGKPPSQSPATPAAPRQNTIGSDSSSSADEDDGRCGEDHALFPHVHDVVVGAGRIGGGTQRVEQRSGCRRPTAAA